MMGMRNYVNQINRVQLPFELPNSLTNVDSVGIGIPQSPMHDLSQQPGLRNVNGVFNPNAVTISRSAINSVMEPVSASHQDPSSIRHSGLRLSNDQQQLRHLQQQQRQMQHEQQNLQHHFQMQQQHQRQIQNNQQPHQILQQPRQHSAQDSLPNMVNVLAGMPTRGLNAGNVRSYSDSTALHSKFPASGIPTHLSNLNNLSNFHANANAFEPRPIDPYQISRFGRSADEDPPTSPSFQETEEVGPLPSRKQVLSKERKNQLLERDNSCSSLVVDNIFSAGDSRLLEQASATATNPVSSKSSRFNLSGLSLSISSDMNEEAEQLGSLLNSSLRLTSKTPSKQPVKRSSSFDHDDASLTEGGSRHHMSYVVGNDMSVATFNTLGDRMSEYGEASMTRMMTESQGEMSIGNVFDDSESLPTKSIDYV